MAPGIRERFGCHALINSLKTTTPPPALAGALLFWWYPCHHVGLRPTHTGTEVCPACPKLASLPIARAVTGVVTVTADAVDDRRNAEVRFTVNGAAIGGQDMAAPYSHSWDIGTYLAGTCEWRTVAEDGSGNFTASGAVTYTIAP